MKLRTAGVVLLAAGGAASALGAQEVAVRERLSLGRALEVALAESRVLRDARLGLSVADQQVREAWANVMPSVRASASYQRNLRVQQAFLPAFIFDPDAPPDELVPVRFGSDNTWQAGLTLEQPLFEYGVFIGVGAAARYRSLEAERVRGAVHDLVTSVRLAYLEALLRMEEVRLTEQSVERVRRTLEETRALNRAGLASDYDVLRLEVQLANLEPNLVRARNGVLAAKRALLATIGRDPRDADRVELEGSLNRLDITAVASNGPEERGLLRYAGLDGEGGAAWQDPEAVSSEALEARSRVQQARLAVELERARLKAQWAEYFPKITLFSSYNITAQENGAPEFFGSARQRASFAFAGLRVELPVFLGFSRDARVQQAKATLAQAEARLQQAEFETVREVRDLVELVDESRRRVESQRQAVAQARRGYEIASAEYRSGLGSQLQITDAEVALRQSEFNYSQAVYDYLVARVRLEAALGRVEADRGSIVLGGSSP
ncbi:Outer membrane protein TolC [bacterium HR33]|nr:Outer membrane protein TolC [bacterium HR33]